MLRVGKQEVKYLRRLAKRHFQEKEGKFLVEGVRFAEEALDSAFSLEMLVYRAKVLENTRGASLLEKAAARGLPCLAVEETLFRELSETVTPQGVIAVARRPWTRLADLSCSAGAWLLVLVDGVQDPGNLGTIIRAADGAGAHGVVLLKGTADIFNPKALRATMGSVFHLPVIQNVAFNEAAAFLKEQGIKLVAGTPRRGRALYQSDLAGSCALLAGNEGDGPGAESLEAAGELIHIPMPGQAESLNVAVSTAIMLYEAVRQRQLRSER